MSDKRESYVTAWTSAQERDLLKQGWTQVGRVHLHDSNTAATLGVALHPVMAPPEPQEPTLAERLRSEIAYGINAELADDAAVALEHYDRLKEAVRVLSLTEPEASGKMPIRVDSDAFGLLLAILREAQ